MGAYLGCGRSVLGWRSGCGGAMPTLALREKPVHVHGGRVEEDRVERTLSSP